MKMHQMEQAMNKYILMSLMMCVNMYPLFAQKEGEIQNETIVIEKKEKLELVPSTRFYDQNMDIQPTPEVKTQTYDLKDYSINPPRFDAKVAIPKLATDSLNPLLGNYVKVGFGNYTTPLFEAYINNKRSKTTQLGLHVRHFSSAKGPVKYSNISTNYVGAYLEKYLKQSTWRFQTSYERNRTNYYGYDHAFEVNKDTLKQVYHYINASIFTQKKDLTLPFQYQLGVDVNYLKTFTKLSEYNVYTFLNLSYAMDDRRKIKLFSAFDLISLQDSSSLARNLITIRPTYEISIDKLNVEAGATINYSGDTLKGSKGVHVYPYITGEYSLVPNQHTVFAGITGGMVKNTLYQLSKENPFIQSNPIMAHTNNKLNAFAGVKGKLNNQFDYQLKMGYSTFTNQVFMTNGAQDSSAFALLYDKGNVGLFQTKAALGYQIDKKWRANVAYTFNSWKTDELKNPWHQPSNIFQLGLHHNLADKILVSMDFYYLSGIKGYNLQSNNEVALKPIADLNLKIDYLFSKKFAAFLEFNNILGKKYQRYLYYSNKGINVLGGITYSF
jgi:hypothetical protein